MAVRCRGNGCAGVRMAGHRRVKVIMVVWRGGVVEEMVRLLMAG